LVGGERRRRGRQERTIGEIKKESEEVRGGSV
jgi:hypothetical protein